MSLNDETFAVTPDSFAYGGAAVATLPSGKRCFIHGGAPGDHLRIRIVSDRKRFSHAEIVEILQPSENRIQPPCPYAKICPGCAYSHVDYPTELSWKQRQFERFLRNAGIQESVIQPPVGAPERLGWRSKIRFTRAPDGTTGYLGGDNRTVLPIRNCLLAEPAIQALLEKAESFCGDPAPNGRTTLTFRCTETDGALQVRQHERNRLLTWTPPGFGRISVPAGSFCQINTAAAAMLLSAFSERLKQEHCHQFLELYCGSGVFSLAACRAGAESAYGIELDPESVKTAEKNALDQGFQNCEFAAGDAMKLYRELKWSGDTLLVDPPRTGLEKPLAELLARKAPRRLFYISCGPDTLSRDLTILTKGKLRVRYSRLFDLFPSTAHFESITELTGDQDHAG